MMKFLDEYRDPAAAGKLRQAIADVTTRPWTLMEICGGQTHAIVKFGIDQLLPAEITLVHGPGCPVCVTPLELIDKALAIAARPDVIFCSFGDMLRVPGSAGNLYTVRASGGDVRIVYSPLDCLEIAATNPDRTVVFFAVGFETTAPANATAIWQAKRRGLTNFAALVSHVLVPPAIRTILSSPSNRVQAFLAAGHVNTIVGFEEYEQLASEFQIPIVVTGFEPLDLLEGIYRTIAMLEQGETGVRNQYVRSVRREGNHHAQRIVAEVFQTTDRAWRGIGVIQDSGLRLRDDFREFDAEQRFSLGHLAATECDRCLSGLILQGLKKPHDCELFGRECTPEHPLGATMVSSEGACAAYFHYGRAPHVK